MEFETKINNANEIKLKLQQLTKQLAVNFFKTVKTKYGDTYLCYNTKYNKTYYSNKQLYAYLSKMLSDLKLLQR